MHGFVEQGVEEGAEVVTGGEPQEGPGAFYPPTVLAQVDTGMTVAQEEIFGPVVTVIPFEDEKDAIRIANDVKYGLMASVWTGDPARGHRVAARIKSGTVGINMPYTAFPGHSVRRLQAVGLRSRARARDARALPRDEERDRQHRHQADQPVRALERASLGTERVCASTPTFPSRRFRSLVRDLLVIVLLVGFALIGLWVHDTVDKLAVLGEGVRKVGSAVPFAGDPVEDLGRRGENDVHHLANVLGFLFFVPPAIALLALVRAAARSGRSAG